MPPNIAIVETAAIEMHLNVLACNGPAKVNGYPVDLRDKPQRIQQIVLDRQRPVKIIACFRPPRTFQAIQSQGMLAFSERLAGLPITGETHLDLYEFMSDSYLENIIFVYLQAIGWYVLPGTRTATTAFYEFILVHRKTGEPAMTQVKSGHTGIDATLYAGRKKPFFLPPQETTVRMFRRT